jgi:hypothetical protein
MELTDRDREIVRWVYAARLATREQVQRLFFAAGSRSLCQRRLTLLWRNRYLDRLPVRSLIDPDVYYISRRATKGLKLLRGILPEEKIVPPKIDPRTVQHALDITSCRVAILQACVATGYRLREWLDERELDERLGHVGFRPDAYFRIEHPTPNGPKRPSFALEVERSQKADISHIRRYQNYAQLYYRSHPEIPSEYERIFGTRGLRVLVLVDAQYGIDPQRQIKKLLNLCRQLEVTMVRFAPLNLFLNREPARLFGDPIWRQPADPALTSLFPATADTESC